MIIDSGIVVIIQYFKFKYNAKSNFSPCILRGKESRIYIFDF